MKEAWDELDLSEKFMRHGMFWSRVKEDSEGTLHAYAKGRSEAFLRAYKMARGHLLNEEVEP